MTLTASSVVLKQKKYLPVHGVSTRANKHVQISSSVERMVLQGGSTLEENETNDADTFYNSLYSSVLTFSSQPPFMSKIIAFICI